MMLICLVMSSSYQIAASASRGRMRNFFSGTKQAPVKPLFLSLHSLKQPASSGNVLLQRLGVGSIYLSRGGSILLSAIVTFFRVSLVNLYTYLARLIGWFHLSLVRLLHSVLLLAGRIVETPTSRHIILKRNEKDPKTMEALSAAIEKLNALGIRNPAGQTFSFAP